MPMAFRVCSAKHGAAAFSGFGARTFGGRWNSKGTTVAYASATLSLSALEYLVHADVQLLRDLPLVACTASWPDELAEEVIAADTLPAGWRETPAPSALAELGDEWWRARRTAILRVPSAIIPSEQNLVINPDHPDAANISYSAPEPFAYDPRLL